MGNMSYCRFENTLRDLDDCGDALEEILNDPMAEPLRAPEMAACVGLLERAAAILELVSEAIGEDVELPAIFSDHAALRTRLGAALRGAA